MKTKLLKQRGFTYLELIVVVGIFSIISTIIAGIFVLYNTAQTKAKMTQKLVSDGRYIMEVMVREIRMGKIDYNSYITPISNPQTVLYLINPDEEIVTFERVTTGCAVGVNACLRVTKGVTDVILSSDTTNLLNLSFYINPQNDPSELISGIYSANDQPLVTLSTVMQSIENPDIQIPIQTTSSSKRYLR